MAGVESGSYRPRQLAGVVLLLSAVVHLTSSMQDCSVEEESGKLSLTHSGVGYFKTHAKNLQIELHAFDSIGCMVLYIESSINTIGLGKIAQFQIDTSNLTPTRVDVRRDSWYEISFSCCDKLFMNVGSRVIEVPINKTRYAEVQSLYSRSPSINLPSCYPSYVKFSITNAKVKCPLNSVVKLNCSEISSLPPLTVNVSVPHSPDWQLFDKYKYNRPTPSISLDGPHIADLPSTYDQSNTFHYENRGEENAIPIFIGVLAFTLSMCMRFCLCRGKNVVQRVTTVTVIRNRPVGVSESQENVHDPTLDPPPAYVDVISETPTTPTPQSEPPPPAYSDIDPPPYYELDMPEGTTPESSEEQGRAARSSQTDLNTQDAPSGSSSAPNFIRVMQNKARAQLKQFSFKPLEEEEE